MVFKKEKKEVDPELDSELCGLIDEIIVLALNRELPETQVLRFMTEKFSVFYKKLDDLPDEEFHKYMNRLDICRNKELSGLEIFARNRLFELLNVWLSGRFDKMSEDKENYYPEEYAEGRDRLVSGQTSILRIAEIEKMGMGLFAKIPIKKGEIAFCIAGEIENLLEHIEGTDLQKTQEGLSIRSRNPDEVLPNAICIHQDQKEIIFDSYPRSALVSGALNDRRFIPQNTLLNPFNDNPLRFLNHSCNPNLGRKGPCVFVAMKDINIGEQLTCDYSILEANPDWKMNCNCGEINCRHEIKGVQSLSPELAKKYWNFMPEFLQSIYRRAAIDKTQFVTNRDLSRTLNSRTFFDQEGWQYQ